MRFSFSLPAGARAAVSPFTAALPRPEAAVTRGVGANEGRSTPPSLLGRPSYLMHGASLGEEVVRPVAVRLALNGVTGSVSSVRLEYYAYPNVTGLLPMAREIQHFQVMSFLKFDVDVLSLSCITGTRAE